MKRNTRAGQKTQKKKNEKSKLNTSEKPIWAFMQPKSSAVKGDDTSSIVTERSEENKEKNITINNSCQEKKNPLNLFIKSEVSEVNISESDETYKNKIIINDNFICRFKELIGPLFGKIEECFMSLENSHNLRIFNKTLFDDLGLMNNESLLIKFFLHIDQRFIYVPNLLSSKRLDDFSGIRSEIYKIKLFEGFQDAKNIAFQYHPITANEVINS